MKARNGQIDFSEMPPYKLGRHWNTIQSYLILGIEDDIGELSEELKMFMEICELLIDERMFDKYRWCGNGRPPSSRISMFKAYILKAMRNYPYTKTLISAVKESPTIRRLCGWESVADIPDKSQFSRTFREFAKDDIGSKALDACLAEYLGRNGIMHGSHDSSEIEAREKSVTRPKSAVESEKPSETRIERQQRQNADANFEELPTECDWGCKRNSQGKIEKWKGYKLHLVVGDGDIPICAFLSSASMHDSQAMIPMMQRASASFDYFYDLADAAYDAKGIKAMSERLGHAPLIDGNPRRGVKQIDDAGAKFINIVPAEAIRYRRRTGIERVFGMLKDSHGGRMVRVKGNKKVFLHLMFGILVIAAQKLIGIAQSMY